MNVAAPKKREWPVIRVFVSSTFTDFKHERDALHQNVFRKLELHREVNDPKGLFATLARQAQVYWWARKPALAEALLAETHRLARTLGFTAISETYSAALDRIRRHEDSEHPGNAI